LDGLTFCAQNPNPTSGNNDYDCSKENSNAYWSFWKAAYKSFTSQIIKGDSGSGSKLVLVIEDPFVDEQFLHDNVLMYLNANTFAYPNNNNANNANDNQGRRQGGGVAHIDIWGVDCNSSIVIKIMKFLYNDNDETTSHENDDNNNNNNMFVTTACHGSDLIELGLCYNNVAVNNNDRDNDYDESSSNNKACNQYKRGKYTRRGGDDGGKYTDNEDNDNEKSDKNNVKTNDVNSDDDIISSTTKNTTILSPKKSNTSTSKVNDNNNKEQKKSNHIFLPFFFPSLVLVIGIYYRHYIIKSYDYTRIVVKDSYYSDGDDGRGSSNNSGSGGGSNISGNISSSASSNYSSFVNPFISNYSSFVNPSIAGESSIGSNNSRSNGSSDQEIGKHSNTNTNNTIAEGEGAQLLSLPYHCVSQ